MWGLYANLIAQLISQVSSHFIIHYHRNIVHRATRVYKQRHNYVSVSVALRTSSSNLSERSQPDDPYGERKDLLHDHAFARPHRGETEKLITRSYVNGCVILGALLLAVLVIVGCILPSAGLEFLGILGVAVESGQGWRQATQSLSMFDLTTLLMDQARFVGGARNYVGFGTLSALLVITVLLVPLAQTATLLWQWFVPMAGQRRKRLSVAVEILQAWQYCEVYIISVMVATWQLGPISTFMINSYCSSFQETFDMLAFFGVIQEEDAQCFRVDASIKGAAYVLAAGAVLLALLNTMVMNAVKQYFRDRDEVNSRAEWKEMMFDNLESAPTASAQSTPSRVQNDKMTQEEQAVVRGIEDLECYDKTTNESSEERAEAEAYIKPVPVLFTDKFRWVLRRADNTEVLNSQGMPASPPPMYGEMAEKPRNDSEISTSDEEPTAIISTRQLSFSLDQSQNDPAEASMVDESVYLDSSSSDLPPTDVEDGGGMTAPTAPIHVKSVGTGAITETSYS
jgi:hypothetical protein